MSRSRRLIFPTALGFVLATALASSSCSRMAWHLGTVGEEDPSGAALATVVVLAKGYPPLFGFAPVEIYQDEQPLGALRSRDYMVWQTKPPSDGEVLIGAKGVQNDFLPVALGPADTVYLTATAEPGFAFATLRLQRIEPAEATRLMRERAGKGGGSAQTSL